MATIILTGSDTIQINDRVFVDIADAEVATLSFPNELVGTKIGKNGNSIFALNETGKEASLELRVLRASSDDKFLNSLKLDMERDFSAFTVLGGEITKRMGDGAGNVSRDIYTLSGGIFKQSIDVASNVEGDTEQAISLYRFTFTNAPRAIA
jgi:hypothetical protein